MALLDKIVPHMHNGTHQEEGPRSHFSKSMKLFFAVTLHNIPEGMAVGAVVAGALHGNMGITLAAAMALAVGMAIQNVPEGAIISLPLRADGMSRTRSWLYGSLSGVVEPIAAGAMILLFDHIAPSLPYLLAFSAGAMLYVVVEELIPETQQGRHSDIGTVAFAIGFVIFYYDNLTVMLCGVCMSAMATFMHRGNIQRLLKGQERKTNLFGKGSKQ